MDANIYLKDSSGDPIGTAANPLVVYPATGTFDIVSPLTTKGDLLTYTTTNTRLAVATDNYLLVPASAEAEGLKWVQLSDINGVTCTGTSLDNKIARFDSTTGKIIQGSYVTIDDNGAISTPAGYGLGIGVTPSYLLHIKGTSTTDLPTHSAEFLDADNWTSTDWTGDWASGWDHTPGNTTVLSHDHAAVNATKYQITFTVTGRTDGTFTITFGGQTSPSFFQTSDWSTLTTSTGSLQITPTLLFDGAIVISIKSLTASTPAISFINSSGTNILEMRIGNTNTNIFIGRDTGRFNITGQYNSIIGTNSFRYNTSGQVNSVLGTYALHDNTAGSYNSIFGSSTMYKNITGNYNVACGYRGLYNNTIGVSNAAVGSDSLYLNISGNYNTGAGSNSLYSITTGNYNTGIGSTAGYNANQLATAVNSMALGANSFTNRSNQVVIGDASVVETHLRTGVYIGSTSTTAHTQPTARLHIAAGSASASTAPIKLTAGTVNTSPEAGAIEFDGTDFYVSI